MSKKVKAKVIKKKKPFPWGSIFYYIKSLFNNGVCLDIATKFKWFWSLIVFVFALLVSVIAPTVQVSKTTGSSIVTARESDVFEYGLGEYLEFANENKDKDIKFNIEKKELDGVYPTDTYDKEGRAAYYYQDDSSKEVVKPIFSYLRDGEHALDIYVDNAGGDDSIVVNRILTTNPNYGDASQADRDNKLTDVKYKRTSSFILFTKTNFYATVFANGQRRNQLSGNYNYILEKFPNLKGVSYTFAEVVGYGLTDTMTIQERVKTLKQNFADYCDRVYVDLRTQQTWITFGIYAGLNGGMMIIMGLIIFLMTRGKNNPNRSMKIWTCYSVGFWMSITPAILALAFGFMMPQFGTMLFIMTYSFRIMYLSMKYLRPAYQQ